MFSNVRVHFDSGFCHVRTPLLNSELRGARTWPTPDLETVHVSVSTSSYRLPGVDASCSFDGFLIFRTLRFHCCDLRLVTTALNLETSVMSRPVNTIVLPLGRSTPGR